MKKLLAKIKVHKKVAMILAALIIGVLIVLFFPKKDAVVTPPTGTKPPVVVIEKQLKLLEVFPEEGAREDVDQFSPTAFQFSEQPDLTSIKYSVQPRMELKFLSYTDSPDVVWMEPVSPWAKGVTYTITINEVRSSQGSVFQGPYTYSLSNTPPEMVEAGDPYTPPIEP